jgi:hypothetical protein
LSGSARAGYNLNNFEDFDVHANLEADLARVHSKNGPLEVGAGLSFDTGFSANSDGLSVNLLGAGFSIGPKIQFSLPFGLIDISFDLF